MTKHFVKLRKEGDIIVGDTSSKKQYFSITPMEKSVQLTTPKGVYELKGVLGKARQVYRKQVNKCRIQVDLKRYELTYEV